MSIAYSGIPEKLRVAVTGTDTIFRTQEWTHFELGEGTFLIYDEATGANKQLTVIVTLIGDNCANQQLSKVLNYTAPAPCKVIIPSCPLTLELSGMGQSEDYSAENTITSTQVFEHGTTATIKANQSILLTAGFHAKAGSSILINNEGCTN